MTELSHGTQHVVTYRGRELERLVGSREGQKVLDDGGPFPDALEQGTSPRGRRWALLPDAVVDALTLRSITATLDGERVLITALQGDRAAFLYQGRDQEWIDAHHLSGHRRDGDLGGTATVDDFRDVQVQDHDESRTLRR